MEQTIKNSLPDLLDQTIFNNKYFQQHIENRNQALEDVVVPNPSYGLFKSNQSCLLGSGSPLQLCLMLASDTHKVDVSSIDLVVKSRFSPGTPRYEKDKINQCKKIGNLITKLLSDDDIQYGTVKKGHFGDLQFGVHAIPIEFLYRYFPFENVSFFAEIPDEIKNLNYGDYADKESPICKAIEHLSLSFDFVLKKLENNKDEASTDYDKMFKHLVTNSEATIKRLQELGKALENFGKSRKNFNLNQIYELFEKIYNFPSLIEVDFTSHLLLTKCLEDKHSTETIETLLERESFRLVAYKQIQFWKPKALDKLKKNLLRLEKSGLGASVKYPKFHLALTHLQMTNSLQNEQINSKIISIQGDKTLTDETAMEEAEENTGNPSTEPVEKDESAKKDDKFKDERAHFNETQTEIKDMINDLGQGLEGITNEARRNLDEFKTLISKFSEDEQLKDSIPSSLVTGVEKTMSRLSEITERQKKLVSKQAEVVFPVTEQTAGSDAGKVSQNRSMSEIFSKKGTPSTSEFKNGQSSNMVLKGSSSLAPDLGLECTQMGDIACENDAKRSIVTKVASPSSQVSFADKNPELEVSCQAEIDNSSLMPDSELYMTASDDSNLLYKTACGTSQVEDSFSPSPGLGRNTSFRPSFSGAVTSTPGKTISPEKAPSFGGYRDVASHYEAEDLDSTALYRTPKNLLLGHSDDGDVELQKKANMKLMDVIKTCESLNKAAVLNNHKYERLMSDIGGDSSFDAASPVSDVVTRLKNLNIAPTVEASKSDSGLGKSAASSTDHSEIHPLLPPLDEVSFNKKVKAATILNKQALAARSDSVESNKALKNLLKSEVRLYAETEKQHQRNRDMENIKGDSNYVSIEISSFYNDLDHADETSCSSDTYESNDSSYSSDDPNEKYFKPKKRKLKKLKPFKKTSSFNLTDFSNAFSKLKVSLPEALKMNQVKTISNAIQVALEPEEDTSLTIEQLQDLLGHYELQKALVQQCTVQLEEVRTLLKKAQDANDPAFKRADDYDKLYGVFLHVHYQKEQATKILETQKKVLEECFKSIDDQSKTKIKREAKTEKQSEIATVLKGFSDTVQNMVKDIYSPKIVDQMTPVKFSGHINDFEDFWNLFDIAVHSNSRFENRPRDKLVQLKSCVQHLRACSEINDMKIEPHNYLEAVAILKRIYNNPEERLKYTNNRLSNKLYPIQRAKDNINIYDYYGLEFIIKTFKRYLEDIALCIDQRLHHGVSHVEKVAQRLPTKELLLWQKCYNEVQDSRNKKAPITIMVKGELVEKPVATNDIADQQLIRHFVFFLENLKRVARQYHAARGNSVDSPNFQKQKSYIKVKTNNCIVKCDISDPKIVEKIEQLNHVDVNQKPELFINAVQANQSGNSGNGAAHVAHANVVHLDKPLPFKKHKNNARKNSNRRKKTARSRDFNYSANNSQAERSRSKSKSRNNFPSSNNAIQKRVARGSRANASRGRQRSVSVKPILKNTQNPNHNRSRSRGRSQSKVRLQSENKNRSHSKQPNKPAYIKTGPTNGNISQLQSKNIPYNSNGDVSKHVAAIQRSQSNNNSQKNKKRPASKKTDSKTFPKGTVVCLFCNSKNEHMTAYCTNKNMTPSQRQTLAIQHKLCLNCLFNGHRAAECKKRPCETSGCQLKHHKLLHDDNARFSRRNNYSKKVGASSNAVNMEIHPSLAQNTQ